VREPLAVPNTQVRTEVADNVLTVTLDRPDRLNAFTPVMQQELIDAFDRADADDDVRAVVVTGAGRGFCAGADLSGGADTFDYDRRAGAGSGAEGPVPRDGGGLVALRIFASTKPVVAAINGPAVGVGIAMTLPMDIRLASTAARMGFVHTRRGIVPEACSSWFLPRVVGISRAMEWVATGRVFDAAEALEAGLVRSVHEPDDLLPAANALAAEIAANASPVSVALSRQMLWRLLGADHPMAGHRLDSQAVYARGRTPDAREGIESFFEKRPPQFPGKVSEDMPAFYPWWDEPGFDL
jgi:enoyl-CoA hydratase/carnithine racemase